MSVKWKRRAPVALACGEIDRMVRDAVKLCLESEDGHANIMSGDTLVMATTDGDGVVEVFDCEIRREGESKDGAS